ncbi:OB-fold domain-containing protein [Streptomyces sp. NBC_00683]
MTHSESELPIQPLHDDWAPTDSDADAEPGVPRRATRHRPPPQPPRPALLTATSPGATVYYRTTNEPAPESAEEPSLLRFQRCTWCTSALFGRRCICPHCGSEDLIWEDSQGSGRIDDYEYRPRKGHVPRLVCLVGLDDGFRIEARLSGCTLPAPTIGTRVRFQRFTDGRVPVFTVLAPATA